jgi:hypothetical protein
MSHGKCIRAVVVLLGTGIGVASCNAQVLSLGDGGTGSSALPEIAASTTIDALTDAQATDLCNWLIDEFPDPNKTTPPRDSPGCGVGIVGWVDGRGLGCGADPDAIYWSELPVSDCVANLRHSPCHSTLDSLEQCVSGFRQAYLAMQHCSAASACATYFKDTACTETVLHDTHYPVGSDQALFCGDCLPIEPGVACIVPYSGPIDGGTD